MKTPQVKLCPTTRKSLPRWQALSSSVDNDFRRTLPNEDSIKTYPIRVNHKQSLIYRSQMYCEIWVYLRLFIKKAKSGQCVSQFTTTRIFAARKQGMNKRGCTEMKEPTKNYSVYGLWTIKKAFYVTCIESNPYQIISKVILGIFSILRGVSDRCRTYPELTEVLC